MQCSQKVRLRKSLYFECTTFIVRARATAFLLPQSEPCSHSKQKELLNKQNLHPKSKHAARTHRKTIRTERPQSKPCRLHHPHTKTHTQGARQSHPLSSHNQKHMCFARFPMSVTGTYASDLLFPCHIFRHQPIRIHAILGRAS